MRVGGYIRVSTEEQASEGYSLAAQEEAIRAYAKAHGWEIVQVYADAGRSGKSLKGREALVALLADAEAGAFDRLIFWKLDRLARNLRDLLQVSDRLEAAGVGIVSIQESIDTGTASGRMMRNVIGSLAEFEREVIIERISVGIQQKARQGRIVGPVSLGYNRDERGDLEPNELAPLVREAFELYATGRCSLRDLTRWAFQRGLRSRNGNPLDRLSIRKLLLNPVYAGDVSYHKREGGGIVARDCHEAIVPREIFERVQRQLERRRYEGDGKTWGNREPYPLTGVAICGSCGKRMVGCRATKRQLRYMRCSTTARVGRDACCQPMIRADLMEGQLRDYLAGMRLPIEVLEEVIGELRNRRNARAHDERPSIQRQIEGWRRLFVMGEIDEARFRTETAPLHRQLTDLDASEQPLDVERALQLLRSVDDLWHHDDRHGQREFITEVFTRVVVEGPYVVEIMPKAGYEALFIVDREERFGGEWGVVWLPDQDSNLEPTG